MQKKFGELRGWLGVKCSFLKKLSDPIPSQIIPHLFLGSVGSAISKTQLHSKKITHILTAMPFKPNYPIEESDNI